MSLMSAKKLLLAGGRSVIDQVFATVLAPGNGLQAAFDALPFVPDLYIGKNRAASADWSWRDRVRGLGMTLATNSSVGQASFAGYAGTANHVGYGLKRDPKLLDIVAYTGNAAASRKIAHALGSKPGVIVVKEVVRSGSWFTYHQSRGANRFLQLNNTDAELTSGSYWNNTEPDSTGFTVGGSLNENNVQYVAWVFAHDTSPAGVVQCGQYVGNGSTAGPVVTLGWEPQFVLFKRFTAAEDWYLLDGKRSSANPRNSRLQPNLSNAESASATWDMDFLPTGFQPRSAASMINASGSQYIYLAIRKGRR